MVGKACLVPASAALDLNARFNAGQARHVDCASVNKYQFPCLHLSRLSRISLRPLSAKWNIFYPTFAL